MLSTHITSHFYSFSFMYHSISVSVQIEIYVYGSTSTKFFTKSASFMEKLQIKMSLIYPSFAPRPERSNAGNVL